MKSEWRVSSNYIGGELIYLVYRIRDLDAVNHSGNREFYGRCYDSKTEAEKVAAQLNSEVENE